MAWYDDLMGALAEGGQGNPNLQDLEQNRQSVRVPTLEEAGQVAQGAAAGTLGMPVDLATMAMRPFGFDTPPEQTVGSSEWFGEKMGADPESATFQGGTFLSPDPFSKFTAAAGLAVPLMKKGDEVVDALMEGGEDVLEAAAVRGDNEVVDALTDQMAPLENTMQDVTVDPLTRQLEELEANRLPEPTHDLVRTDFIYNDEAADLAPGTNTTRDVGKQVQQQALDYWGGAPMEHTPENFAKLHDNMFEEAWAAYERQPDVAEWYKNNLAEAVSHAEKVYPQIAKDPSQKAMFLLTKAITSNGQEVAENSRWTKEVFDHFTEHGRFPEFGRGKQTPAMQKSFQEANRIIDEDGVDGFAEFLRTPYTKKELIEAGFNVKGLKELMDYGTHGSVIFGPKIGGGFFQNLDGNFKPVTFDMWWTRTWGRHTGTAMKDASEQRAAFRQALMDDPDSMAKYGDVGDVMADDDALDALASKAFGQFSAGGFKDKTPFNNSARNLKARIGVNDDPGAGSNRALMREAVSAMQQKFAERGVEMDNAAIQALLWYVEKDLYRKMGVRGPKKGTDDYASAWKQIAGG